MPTAATHVSPYAGNWYPDDPEALRNLLTDLWRSSEERTGPCVLRGGKAFVVPHAGLIYSGTVAASVYRHLEIQRPERIVLLGFCHRGSAGGVSIPDVNSFQVPNGQVRVDRDCVAELLAHPPFQSTSEVRLCDHSIEIQLPLLRRSLPAARVVPLYIGHLDPSERAEAAGPLATLLREPGTVFLASSDLTHYGGGFHFQPFPVDARTPDRLRDLDAAVIEAASSLWEELFLDALRETSATVCGYDPVSLLLAVLRRVDADTEIFQEELDYQTSGEITGDFHHSVSYGALGFFPHTSFDLGVSERELLLEIARKTLAEYQRTGRRSAPVFAGSPIPALQRRCGVFVTLRKNGQLRGCLGRTTHLEPLQHAVPDLTLSAALEDRRFDPLQPSESGIDIEISVLTPMKRILDAADFRLHAHGALLKAGGRQGVLLPQVAAGRNWEARHFLEALARKAGVNTDVFAEPSTRLYVFRAQVIPNA